MRWGCGSQQELSDVRLDPPKMDSFKMELMRLIRCFFLMRVDFCSSLEYISSSLREGNQYGE